MEKFTIHYEPDLPQAGKWTVENSSRRCFHYHETYTICSLNRYPNGFNRWKYRKKEFITAARQLMLMEPGDLHVAQEAVGYADYSVLYVQPSFVAEVAKENALSQSIHLKAAAVNQQEAAPSGGVPPSADAGLYLRPLAAEHLLGRIGFRGGNEPVPSALFLLR